MFDKKNENYKFYLAGIISESEYYDRCEENKPIEKVNEVSDDHNQMLIRNLKDIVEHTNMLLDMVDESSNLHEWMESKIAVCKAYISDVAHAFKNDKEEDEEEGGCGGIPVASMGAKSMDLTPITSLYQAMR